MRVGGGFGTISAKVEQPSSSLEVRDNREGITASASADAVTNGQGEKEESGSKASADSLTEPDDKANGAKVSLIVLIVSQQLSESWKMLRNRGVSGSEDNG